MARFGRQHEYRIGWAVALSAGILLLGSWVFPVEWLRVFGHRLPPEADWALPATEPWVRLIPVSSLDNRGKADEVPTRMILRSSTPKSSTDKDYILHGRREWAFDPTTAFRGLPGSAEPLAPSPADSLALHAEFLHSLRLANLDAVFALLDTTQTARAREQLAETDAWVNHRLGPVWRAEGHARFQSSLWWRVVGEVEAEGAH